MYMNDGMFLENEVLTNGSPISLYNESIPIQPLDSNVHILFVILPEIRMIPLRFLSKMGNYNIRIGGDVIHVRVVDNADLVDKGLFELRPQIGMNTAVGLLFKSSQMLQICVGNHCLMVLLSHMDISNIPQSLKKFLAEQGICFVGVATSLDHMNMGFYGIECKNIVDVSELSARVHKKPHLYGYGRESKKLVAEVGFQLEC